MRRFLLTAFLAVPLFLTPTPTITAAGPPDCRGFGCGGICLRLFPNLHQNGPLFNYGPYYGYYPFKPYGPWDEYLRYDPFFYGDPYRDWGTYVPPTYPSHKLKEKPTGDNMYGWKNGLGEHLGGSLSRHGWSNWPHLFPRLGCNSCGFWHASWLRGGWFRGHVWLHGGFGHRIRPGCISCGGVAVATPAEPTGDALARYSGIGTPTQSAVFYANTPTLDPSFDLVPTAGQN
jgi:hypothetical protein